MNRSATSPPLPAEAVVDELRSHDILPTHQRLEIARALFTCRQHLSADQVLAMVNAERPHVSKATVYNTLNLFARKGLVREVIVDPSRVFYDPNNAPHHHFYNVDTGELTDVAPDEFILDAVPDAPPGTITEGVDVIIRVRSADRT